MAYAMVHPDAPPWMPDPNTPRSATSFSFEDPSNSCFYELSASTWGKKKSKPSKKCFMAASSPMGPEVAAFEREFADYFGMAGTASMVNPVLPRIWSALPRYSTSANGRCSAVTKHRAGDFVEHDVPSAPAIRIENCASLTWNAIR